MILKFRAWDKLRKRMLINIQEVGLSPSGVVSYVECEAMEVLGGGNLILMQYTGLKDKNGVEIFEGDVVRVDDYKNIVVKFGKIEHEENYGDVAIYQGFNLQIGGGYPEPVKYNIEIIGNIYELERVEE